MNTKTNYMLSKFIENAGSYEDACELIKSEVIGELEEFTARDCDGYIAYGNGEALFFIDDEEEPYILYADSYGDNVKLVWG